MSAPTDMSTHADVDDKVNMVPLIDCMFFLILFFLLVTRFTSVEQAITSLLPSDQGPTIGPPRPLANPQINIAIYPAGLERGQGAQDYAEAIDDQIAHGRFAEAACVRVGGSTPVVVRGDVLDRADARQEAEVGALHAAIAAELATREEAGMPRADQHPVVVSCYSGLSWKYALLAYDAVRAYEGALPGGRINRSAEDLADARAVSFAPPLIRNGVANESGVELEDIMHLR